MGITQTDLLVIGAGPTGLMTAITAARTGIKVRIIDKRTSRITAGHADGLMERTLEILDSFGLAERMLREKLGYIGDTSFWTSDSNGMLYRSLVDARKSPVKSRFKRHGISQAALEGCMIDLLRKEYRIEVERGVTPIRLRVAEDFTDYPVQVELTQAADSDDAATKSIIAAKFLAGCDGIHSWTRQELNILYSEERINKDIAGAIDIIPITDFPDIRTNCRILTPQGWSAIIPRENNLVRIYAKLGTVEDARQAERLHYTPADILVAAQKVWYPYKITYKHLSWHTNYSPAERLASRWSDDTHRIFLAGDACHTHDPSTGQGMNTSTADGYNLGWKIALVARGLVSSEILATTYESERRPVPEFLIEYDKLTIGLGGRGKPTEEMAKLAGLSVEEYQRRVPPRHAFQPGLHVRYGPNLLVRDDLGRKDAAKGVTLGMRMPSCEVVNHATGEIGELAKFFVMDGRFRMLVFPGNVCQGGRMKRLERFVEALERVIVRFTPPLARESNQRLKKGVFDTLTVHLGERKRVEMLDLPDVLLEFDDIGGWNYEKVFVDLREESQGDVGAYEELGVEREEGAVIVMRPDQYVGFIDGLDCGDDLMKYFEGFMFQQRDDYYQKTEKLWRMPWDEDASSA